MGKPEASPKQKGYILGLSKKLGLDFGSDDVEFLDVFEANNMIRSMKEALYGSSEDPSEKMRMKIISMARSIGWENNNRADMDRINSWSLKYGQFHKQLNDHSYDELVHLVSQFQFGPFKSKFERV